uniref:Uncharacterized protein n=1 Tax=Anopheles minimus TaxID=112268 RepID=A0A182VZD9_9DIPT
MGGKQSSSRPENASASHLAPGGIVRSIVSGTVDSRRWKVSNFSASHYLISGGGAAYDTIVPLPGAQTRGEPFCNCHRSTDGSRLVRSISRRVKLTPKAHSSSGRASWTQQPAHLPPAYYYLLRAGKRDEHQICTKRIERERVLVFACVEKNSARSAGYDRSSCFCHRNRGPRKRYEPDRYVLSSGEKE